MFVVKVQTRLDNGRFEEIYVMSMAMLISMVVLMSHAIVMDMNQLSVFRTMCVLKQSQMQAVAYKNCREGQG